MPGCWWSPSPIRLPPDARCRWRRASIHTFAWWCGPDTCASWRNCINSAPTTSSPRNLKPPSRFSRWSCGPTICHLNSSRGKRSRSAGKGTRCYGEARCRNWPITSEAAPSRMWRWRCAGWTPTRRRSASHWPSCRSDREPARP